MSAPTPASGGIEPVLYRYSEVARLLGVSRSTVYRLVDAGELEHCKVLTSPRISRDVVDDYVRRIAQPDDATNLDTRGEKSDVPPPDDESLGQDEEPGL